MKYKVGDKVKIKSLDWYNANKDINGIVKVPGSNFVKGMSKHCGKVYEITSVVNDHYILSINENLRWTWTNEMFETFNDNMEPKIFKCKDEVIYRSFENDLWTYGIYSHYDERIDRHRIDGHSIPDSWEILPFKDNKHLVGTTNSPEEEIKLEKGDVIVCSDVLEYITNGSGYIGKYDKIYGAKKDIGVSYGTGSFSHFKYCILFSKFNLNDLEATKKEILTVKNGKLVKVFK